MFTVWLRNLFRPNRALSPETHDRASRLGTAPSQSRPIARWRAVLGTAAGVGALSLLAWLLQTRASDVAADSAKSDKGFSYLRDQVASVPWSVHIAKIDRREPTLEIHSTLAKGTILGLSTLTEQVLSLASELGTPLAAVNGDMYQRENSSYAGDPRGLQIVEGDLVSAPVGGAAFWIDAAGDPHATNVASQFKVTWPQGRRFPFGLNEERRSGTMVLFTPTLGRATRARGGREYILERADKGPWLPLRVGETYTAKVREASDAGNTRLAADIMVLSVGEQLAANLPPTPAGTILRISTATLPTLTGVKTAIGGGSVVTLAGKMLPVERPVGNRFVDNYSIRSMYERHPRSGLGWNKTHLFLIEVDGRQRGLSVGMTVEELGEYMAKLGCEEAMSLDGGGSSTFWYRGRVVNSPCDGTERPVANGLVVVRKVKSAAH